MRMTVKVEVNYNTKAVRAAGAGFAADFADQMGELTAKYARENVAPGVGPGPHPHRPGSDHEDTGELQRSIQVRHVRQGFLETSHVFSDLPYSVYLCLGWTSRSGKHWRYPFMLSAAMRAQYESASIAQSTARRWFSEEGYTYKGRSVSASYINAPLSATAWPE